LPIVTTSSRKLSTQAEIPSPPIQMSLDEPDAINMEALEPAHAAWAARLAGRRAGSALAR
jgi:hypothetical protein